MTHRLVLIGPPGSGKGTQARRLAERLKIMHLSMGDALRTEAARGSPIGKEVQGYLDRGELVPVELTNRILAQRIEHADGFLLDGYPRSLEQARFLESITTIDHAILIDVSDEVSVERIAGRRICSVCGKEYHARFAPPKIDGKCDDDGGELVQRSDHSPEIVRNRLLIYHEQTEPVISFYKERLLRIDGEQPIDTVFSAILAALGE